MFDLSGKVAVVTGSSRGIGRATVEALAAAGARVVVSSRKAGPCEEVAQGIRDRGGEAIVIPCNISRKDELMRLVDETELQLGPIDILVCNAASNPVYGPIGTVSDEAFDKIIANNVKSSFWLCNRVIPGMAARGGGAVVLVSSVMGLVGSGTIGVYAVSKAADAQLARNYAIEWSRKNVRVNCVSPGLIRTDFAKALFEQPGALDFINRMTPAGRAGEPEDIAGVVLFLASDAASFITGQNIIADGGMTIAGGSLF